MFRKSFVAYSEYHTKPIKGICGRHAEFLTVKAHVQLPQRYKALNYLKSKSFYKGTALQHTTTAADKKY
jgi:hypothetical protein